MFSLYSTSVSERFVRWFFLGITIVVASVPHAQAQNAQVSNVMTTAVSARDALPTAEGSLWRFEGPRNLEAGSHSLGLDPYSGRINEVAVDPSNPFVMYATGATGGIWKTANGGSRWADLSTTWPIQGATAVAVDPNNTNRVFVGTGDYKRMDWVEPFSVGIMRSLNGGLTWELPAGTDQMRDFTVSRIIVDTQNSDHVLASAGRGSRLPGGTVFRSTNAGATWGSVGLPDANWDDLRLCDQHTFWAAATRKSDLDSDNGSSALLYKSTNGVSWSKVTINTSSLTLGSFNLDTFSPLPDTIKIACANTSLGNVVFVAVFWGNKGIDEAKIGARVFGTLDRGSSWFEVTGALVPTGSGPWAHAALTLTTNRLYIAGVYQRFAPLSGLVAAGSLLLGNLSFQSVSGLATDFQCAVPDPTEVDAVFLCNDKGVYRHSAQTNSSVSLNTRLGVTQVFRMDVHPRHGGLIAAGAQDLGDFVSFYGRGTDAAAIDSTNWEMISGCDGRSAAFKGDSTSRVYLSISCGEVDRYDGTVIAETPNAQVSLQDSSAAPSGQLPLVYRPGVDILDFADTRFKGFVNPDSGITPRGPFTFSYLRGQGIQSLGVCPTNSQILYAGSEEGEFFYSTNGGQTWRRRDQPNLPEAPIWAVSGSPTNCNDVLIAVGYEGQLEIRHGTNTFIAGERLFRKTDMTVNGPWTAMHGVAPQALPKAPLFAIARHPSAPDSTWFVSGDVGVFRTDDAGAHWANATAPLGLPSTLVRDLRLTSDANTLYAATFGRGIWSMDVTRPSPGVFGVRGFVTQGSQPVFNATVSASGAGRIKKFLKTTLTSGFNVTTAPIAIASSATISSAAATIEVQNTLGVSLITPNGTALPMALLGGGRFQLTAASAAALVGQEARGNWSFRMSGITLPLPTGTIQLNPSVKSASVELLFTGGISTTTGTDGEFTLEYLNQGIHLLVTEVQGTTVSQAINLVSNRTNINLALAPVGVANMEPKQAFVDALEPLTYSLAYTITEGRNWRDLKSVQLKFRDDEGTVLWVEFDPAQLTLSLVDPDTGRRGPAFAPGHPNRLETSAATVLLANSQVQTGVPNPSSVTLNLAVSFKPQADARVFDVEVITVDKDGISQGPDLVGRLQVGEVTSPKLPDPPEEEIF